MLLSLLLTACLAASPTPQSDLLQSDVSDLPVFQQFCFQQGFGTCFAVENVDITSASVTVGDRAPLSITGLEQFPITALGETGTEYEFATLWGRGLLVQMPGDDGFSGEIDLDNDMVLHIFPCVNREECTSFGYELHMEHVPEAMGDVKDDDNDNVSRRLRRLLQSFTGSNSPSATPRPDSAPVETLRRSLDGDSMSGECEFWGSECTATLRMVFPMDGSSLLGINYETLARWGATMIVAEFNAAMRRTVDTGSVQYRMQLDAVEFSAFSFPGRGIGPCQEYMIAQESGSGAHTDLTQCVYNEERLYAINADTGIAGAGEGYRPGRVSWMRWQGMPFNSWGHDQIHLHEFGHNFGGTHDRAWNLGQMIGTTMVIPSTADRTYGLGFSAANAAEIRRNFPMIANGNGYPVIRR